MVKVVFSLFTRTVAKNFWAVSAIIKNMQFIRILCSQSSPALKRLWLTMMRDNPPPSSRDGFQPAAPWTQRAGNDLPIRRPKGTSVGYPGITEKSSKKITFMHFTKWIKNSWVRKDRHAGEITLLGFILFFWSNSLNKTDSHLTASKSHVKTTATLKWTQPAMVDYR